jgi:hypothetical protein
VLLWLLGTGGCKTTVVDFSPRDAAARESAPSPTADDAAPAERPAAEAAAPDGTDDVADASPCLTKTLDHDIDCVSVSNAKESAYNDCRQMGFELTDIRPGVCGAGEQIRISYTCCPPGSSQP